MPALLASLDRLPAVERWKLAGVMLERWGEAREGDSRTLSYGDWRAREALKSAEPKREVKQASRTIR